MTGPDDVMLASKTLTSMTPKNIHCSILFNSHFFVFALNIDQCDTALEFRNKLHDKNYFSHWAILPQHVNLWKLLSPLHRGDDELKKIHTSLDRKDKNPYGLEKVHPGDKIVNIFDISAEQEGLIQVLAHVEVDNISGMDSIYLVCPQGTNSYHIVFSMKRIP